MDLQIVKKPYYDSTDTDIVGIPALSIIVGTGKRMLVNAADVIVNYNVDPSYVAMSIHNQNIYVYASGDTLNGGAIANASAMYSGIAGIIAHM
jgi:hypothetical protein